MVYLRKLCGIFSIGSLRQNLARGLKFLPEKKIRKKVGAHISNDLIIKKKFTVIQWYDNKSVIVTSTFANIEQIPTLQRYSKEQKKRISVTCPNIIRECNRHMGGADIADMLVALYRTPLNTKK